MLSEDHKMFTLLIFWGIAQRGRCVGKSRSHVAQPVGQGQARTNDLGWPQTTPDPKSYSRFPCAVGVMGKHKEAKQKVADCWNLVRELNSITWKSRPHMRRKT